MSQGSGGSQEEH